MRIAFVGLLSLAASCELAPSPRIGAQVALAPNSSFAAIQKDILEPRCARPNCHGQPRAAPMSLTGDRAFDNLVRAKSRQTDMHLVEPFSPQESYLMLKLRGRAGDAGGRPTQMPLNRSPLSEDELERIASWIAEGALIE